MEFNPPIKDCISVTAAAKYAGCCRSNIARALQRGRIKGIKHGRQWWTTTEAIDEYYRSRWVDWLNPHEREERAAKARAGWICRRCGCDRDDRRRTNRQGLKIYYRDRNKENQTPDNMIPLCFPCHRHAMQRHHPDQLLLPGMELPEWLRKGGPR